MIRFYKEMLPAFEKKISSFVRMRLNTLVIGSGGREHAFCKSLFNPAFPGTLFACPGNAGTASIAINLPGSAGDLDDLLAIIRKHAIGLVVVGPELPLTLGLADRIKQDPELSHVKVVGPGSAGARLEGSKDFSKQFMLRYGIPTASAMTVTQENVQAGIEFLNTLREPFVLKADGLAAGKGVLILNTREEAVAELHAMLGGKFSKASEKVLIEEFLTGIEVSFFAALDGQSMVLLPEAKDYKRIGEGDTGPNTGGMGAVSPVDFCDEAFRKKVLDRVLIPTLEGLKKEGIDYKGFLFAGLMNVNGEPYVIEYNCRMGDPETEAVLPRLRSDFYDLCLRIAGGNLSGYEVDVDPRYALTTVLVSGGYPEHYQKGKVIHGLHGVTSMQVFHAGTRQDGKDVVSDGGRVLACTVMEESLEESMAISAREIPSISFEGIYYRKDIGADLVRPGI